MHVLRCNKTERRSDNDKLFIMYLWHRAHKLLKTISTATTTTAATTTTTTTNATTTTTISNKFYTDLK